jgi:hypothetical protein
MARLHPNDDYARNPGTLARVMRGHGVWLDDDDACPLAVGLVGCGGSYGLGLPMDWKLCDLYYATFYYLPSIVFGSS